jgi:hypothetical protein
MSNLLNQYKNIFSKFCNIILFILLILVNFCKYPKYDNKEKVDKVNKSDSNIKKSNKLSKNIINIEKKNSIIDFVKKYIVYDDIENINNENIDNLDSISVGKQNNYLAHKLYNQWKDTILVFTKFSNEKSYIKNLHNYEKSILDRLKNDSLVILISINEKIYTTHKLENDYYLVDACSFIFNKEKYIYFTFAPKGVAGRPILSCMFFKVLDNRVLKIKDFYTDNIHSNLIKDYNKDKKIDIIYNKEENIDTLCCKNYASISKKLGILTLENDTFLDYEPESWFIDYCFYSNDTIKICKISGFNFK